MKSSRYTRLLRNAVAILCAMLVGPFASLPSFRRAWAASSDEQAAKIPADQLDSLVAPIALYPDDLLAQVLVASTYPLEIVQLQQWLERNKNLKGNTLVDAVSKQPWDPSVQAMAALPEVVKRLADDIQWTTDLGNAFLAQQSDVMDAVQRMRKKAESKGTLQSTEQQTVETKTVDNESVIVIQQADPQVVYVPSYNPTVVYGAAPYPYPPIYYPPAGYYAAGMALSFGVGIAMGAAWSGGWGWGCGWGGNNDVTINNNNNFNRNESITRGDRGNVNRGDRGKWQHNPQHRGGAPYRDRATASKFGGNARGDSLANRQSGARQQLSRQGQQVSRPASDRSGAGSARDRGGASARSGSTRDLGSASARSGSTRDLGGSRGASGSNRIGNRDMSRGYGGGGRSDGFGGGSRGYSGSSARTSGSRGASSFSGGGGRGGGFSGGGSRGGGGRGGGGRGGGGRRR